MTGHLVVQLKLIQEGVKPTGGVTRIHLMYNHLDQQVKPALNGVRFAEAAWNKGTQKYPRRDMLNGKPVQMLIDTG